MGLHQTYFQQAQALYKGYFTHTTNKTIESNISHIFDGEINDTYFEQEGISPREFLNQFLQKNYPNEITIKSNFINKVITKTKKHVTIFELKVGSSRIDLCKINGHSTAYEIKTELDSPKRLEGQMKDYFQFFEEVYLICPENKLSIYADHIPNTCGIYTYRISKKGNYYFKLVKKAAHSTKLSPELQISAFSKKEMLSYFLNPCSADRKEMSDWILNNYTGEDINRIFKFCLKERYQKQWNFLASNKEHIMEIDYQWFFKNQISPEIVYL